MEDDQPEWNEKQLQRLQTMWRRYSQFTADLKTFHGEVLAAHLTVESELDDALGLVMHQPQYILDTYNFSQKLRLLEALVPVPGLLGRVGKVLRALNDLRNKIAHRSSPEAFDAAFQKLLKCAQQNTSFRTEQTSDSEQLKHLSIFLCGYLSGCTDPTELHALRITHK
jgi:hypothetical protein